MGERGLISQILSPKFGGFIVYGSMDGNSLPGLPTLDSLRKAYKVDCINGDTIVFGLISKPVSHSKGPILHNPALRHVKFNGIYVPMFVDDLKKFFNVYSSQDFAGFRYAIFEFDPLQDYHDILLLENLSFLILYVSSRFCGISVWEFHTRKLWLIFVMKFIRLLRFI